MSIAAMKAVWRHSKTKGNARMVLTLIADAANHEGWDSYPFQETLAEMAGGLNLRTIEKCIAQAVAAKELEVHRPDRSTGNRYSIMLPGLPIYDDEAEREKRDREYEKIAAGAREVVRQKRLDRRVEDPNQRSGPSKTDPNGESGPTRTESRVPPERTDGSHPNADSGHIRNPSVDPSENPIGEGGPPESIEACAERLCMIFRRELDKHGTVGNGGPGSAAWTNAMRRVLEDGKSAAEVEAVIIFATTTPFWQPTIVDPASLLRKYDVLLRQQKRDAGKPPKPEYDPAPAELEQLPESTWSRAMEIFRNDVSEDVSDLWLSQCQPIGRDGNTVWLLCSERAAGWIQLRYERALGACIARALGVDEDDVAVRFTDKPPTTQEAAAA